MQYCELIDSGGIISIQPFGQAPVCRGDPLQLVCNTTEVYLRWSYSVHNEQGVLTDYIRTVSSIDPSQQRTRIVVNSTSFDFLRISGQGMPLISTMTINSVETNLNGVIVGCLGINVQIEATTTINLVNESYLGELNYNNIQCLLMNFRKLVLIIYYSIEDR